MDKSIQEQTKKTLELIVLLTFLYIIVFFFFPENEKNTAEMSTLPISKFNGQTQRFQVDTDSDTKDTYIRINNETAIPGTPLTITIVNPKEPVSKWTVTWKVASSEIPVVSDSYTPTASDSENFISVKAVTPTGIPYETSVYMSSLPVLYITTNDEITDNDCPAMLHMQGNENFKKDENLLYDGEISIRLSEDSAKDLPKLPYAMTLQNSSNLLNMGDSEHWQLLANATDHTLIRNQLMFQLSEQMEFSFAPKSEHAVLIVNNDYQGIYLLCEDLIIDENHISITNWEQLAKDAAAAITEKEQGDDIVFLRKIVPGGADKSYGIQVAKLAGVPVAVTDRAAEIVAQLMNNDITGKLSEIAIADPAAKRTAVVFDDVDKGQMSFFDTAKDEDILKELEELDITKLTPLDALNTLYKYQSKLKNRY